MISGHRIGPPHPWPLEGFWKQQTLCKFRRPSPGQVGGKRRAVLLTSLESHYECTKLRTAHPSSPPSFNRTATDWQSLPFPFFAPPQSPLALLHVKSAVKGTNWFCLLGAVISMTKWALTTGRCRFGKPGQQQWWDWWECLLRSMLMVGLAGILEFYHHIHCDLNCKIWKISYGSGLPSP